MMNINEKPLQRLLIIKDVTNLLWIRTSQADKFKRLGCIPLVHRGQAILVCLHDVNQMKRGVTWIFN
jgi:hypothetical protein